MDKWQVDLENKKVTHESGIIVAFDDSPDDDGGIDGSVENIKTLREQSRFRPNDYAERLHSLMREAGEVYLAALKEKDGNK